MPLTQEQEERRLELAMEYAKAWDAKKDAEDRMASIRAELEPLLAVGDTVGRVSLTKTGADSLKATPATYKLLAERGVLLSCLRKDAILQEELNRLIPVTPGLKETCEARPGKSLNVESCRPSKSSTTLASDPSIPAFPIPGSGSQVYSV